MALADIENSFTEGVPWRTCAVCHHMTERGDDWSASMRRLLSNRQVKFTELAARLAADDEEPDVGVDALSRHARGLCSAKEVLR